MNYDKRPLFFDENKEFDDAVLAGGASGTDATAERNHRLDAFREKLEARRQNMSGKRELRIPSKLEQRRQEWMIPDELFYFPATFDWVGVYQIRPVTGELQSDGVIIKPEQTQNIEVATASRGIVVTAGLSAMDSLSDHGIEIGDIVRFVRLSPWRQQIVRIGAEWFELVMLKPGDICADEDHWQRLQSREMRLARDDEDGKHYFKTSDGSVYRGQTMPVDLGDY